MEKAAHLQNFERPKSPMAVFVGLNILRAISAIVLLLMIIANIVTVNHDWKVSTRAEAEDVVAGSAAKRHFSPLGPIVHQRDWDGLAARVDDSATVHVTRTILAGGAASTPTVVRGIAARQAAAPAADEDESSGTSSATATRTTATSAPVTATSTAAPAAKDDDDSPEGHAGYYPDTTVPKQGGGKWLSMISRVVTMLACTVLMLSEIGFPRRLFTEYLVMLGPESGLGWLGLLQLVVSSGVLSHYCKFFLKGVAWALLIVGTINIALGFFGSRIKDIRAFTKERGLQGVKSIAKANPQARAAIMVAEGGYGAFQCLQRKRNERRARKEADEEAGYQEEKSDIYAGAAAAHADFGAHGKVQNSSVRDSVWTVDATSLGHTSPPAHQLYVKTTDRNNAAYRGHDEGNNNAYHQHDQDPSKRGQTGNENRDWDDGMSDVYYPGMIGYAHDDPEVTRAKHADSDMHLESQPPRSNPPSPPGHAARSPMRESALGGVQWAAQAAKSKMPALPKAARLASEKSHLPSFTDSNAKISALADAIRSRK